MTRAAVTAAKSRFARQTPRFIEREGDVDALVRLNPDRDPLASLR
jgi:hypothetical protein